MPTNQLWYKQEAQAWVEALPLGNGRLGAMMFSGVKQERISLNEDSFWAGYPRDKNAHGAADHLPDVQRLILEDKLAEAQRLAEDHMEGRYTESIRPLRHHPGAPGHRGRHVRLPPRAFPGYRAERNGLRQTACASPGSLRIASGSGLCHAPHRG